MRGNRTKIALLRRNNPQSDGPCRMCRKKRFCYKGHCIPCRQQPDRRQLVEAGVAPGTADTLAYLMHKCKSTKEAQKVLGIAHPMVMENVCVKGGPVLTLRIKTAHWVRRQGWRKGKNDQWSEGR